MKTNLRHVGIVVRDLESVMEFFVRVFDFAVVIDQKEDGEFIDKLLGLSLVQLRTVKLKSNSEVMLELLEFKSPTPLSSNSTTQPNSLGITHIALTVVSMEDVFRRMPIGEFQVIGGPIASVDGKVTVSYVRGPEGILLEIVEPR